MMQPSTAFKMLNSDQFSEAQDLILAIQMKDHIDGELHYLKSRRRNMDVFAIMAAKLATVDELPHPSATETNLVGSVEIYGEVEVGPQFREMQSEDALYD